MIYDNHEAISLLDENLSYCDHIMHTIILTMTHKPVYLPHCTISSSWFKIYYFDRAPILNNDGCFSGALQFLHVIYNI